MNPVAPNINNTSSGCSSTTSSNCVTFQGVLPSCISWCAGDSITDVIQSIATVACDALNVSQYNTGAITSITTNEIEGFDDLIEGIISSIIIIESQLCEDCNGGGGGGQQDPGTIYPVELADCLVDRCEACLPGTQYPLDVALETGFGILCQAIEAIELDITNLNFATELYVDEAVAAGVKSAKEYADNTVYAAIQALDSCIKVTVAAHELTGPSSGSVVCVNDAVSYLANKVNAHFTVLGSVAELQQANGFQEVALYQEACLNPANAGSTLGDIGVTNSAATTAQSLKNVWTVLQDIRYGLIDCCINASIPCVLVPVRNIQITTVTSVQATVTWSAHGLSTIETETGFTVEVLLYDGVQAVGPVLLTQPGGITGTTIDVTSLDHTKEYIVRVISNYDCGIATAEVFGQLKACAIEYYVHLEKVYASSPDTCNAVNYTKAESGVWTVSLRQSTTLGSTLINNTTGSDITIKLKMPFFAPSISPSCLFEVYEFVIPNNNNQVVRTDLPDFFYKIFNGVDCDSFYRDFMAVTQNPPGIEPTLYAQDTIDNLPCNFELVYTASLYE